MKFSPNLISRVDKEENGSYALTFPNLNVTVTVSKRLYMDMRRSGRYDFQNESSILLEV